MDGWKPPYKKEIFIICQRKLSQSWYQNSTQQSRCMLQGDIKKEHQVVQLWGVKLWCFLLPSNWCEKNLSFLLCGSCMKLSLMLVGSWLQLCMQSDSLLTKLILFGHIWSSFFNLSNFWSTSSLLHNYCWELCRLNCHLLLVGHFSQGDSCFAAIWWMIVLSTLFTNIKKLSAVDDPTHHHYFCKIP